MAPWFTGVGRARGGHGDRGGAVDLTAALCAGDLCFPEVRSFVVDDIVEAHEVAEHPAPRGRVVVTP